MGEVVVALALRRRPHNFDDQNKQRYADDKRAEHQVQLRNGPDGYAAANDGEISIDHLLLGGQRNLDGVYHLR